MVNPFKTKYRPDRYKEKKLSVRSEFLANLGQIESKQTIVNLITLSRGGVVFYPFAQIPVMGDCVAGCVHRHTLSRRRNVIIQTKSKQKSMLKKPGGKSQDVNIINSILI